jgi:hypothetical protein
MKEINAAIELTKMNLVKATPDEKDGHIFACHEAMRNLIKLVTPCKIFERGYYAHELYQDKNEKLVPYERKP